MIITRTKNVWIKFISFINDMWEKGFFEVFSSTRKSTEGIAVSVKISYLWK